MNEEYEGYETFLKDNDGAIIELSINDGATNINVDNVSLGGVAYLLAGAMDDVVKHMDDQDKVEAFSNGLIDACSAVLYKRIAELEEKNNE